MEVRVKMPARKGKTKGPGASIGRVPYDVLAPEQEFERVQTQLKRRPTLEVKRTILESQLEALKDDPHLQLMQVEPGAGGSPARRVLDDGGADERPADVSALPELSRATRADGSAGPGGVRCTCTA
ncbi:unnamed protein product [Prorocentrum cordatum]|uniref:Uncharacterized protein n=1 Tax=Prorocentrum cordatum TaxID=2364126 RepID=A0ABN9WJH0_9DINO|nr:unnamed protein product [Polarella glacialis]